MTRKSRLKNALGALLTATAVAVSAQPVAFASAVTTTPLSAGDLIKGSSSSVYLYGADNRRHAFPNEQVYRSWFQGFDGVKTINDTELSALPLGKNVTYRPGVRLVKVVTDPRVYAVGANGELHWVQTEDLAAELYGTAWSHQVEDVPDTLFTDYRVGSIIASSAVFRPSEEVTKASVTDLFSLNAYVASLPASSRGSSGGGGGGGSSSSPVANTTPATTSGENNTPATTAGLDTESERLTAYFNGPASASIATGAHNVILANYTLTAHANLEFRNTHLTLTVATVAGSSHIIDPVLTNIRIIDASTGATVAGPIISSSFSNGGDESLVFTETYGLMAGQSKTYAIQADVDWSVADGTTVKVTLGDAETATLFGNDDVLNLENKAFLDGRTAVVPGAPLFGNEFLIERPSLAVALAASPTSQAYPNDSQGVSMLGVVLKAGDAADVKLDYMNVFGYIDKDRDGTFKIGSERVADESAYVSDAVFSVGLWNDSTQIGTSTYPDSNGRMSFNNLNLPIAKGTSVTLTVKADLHNMYSLPNDIKFDLTPSADVLATYNESTVANVYPTTGMINGTATTAIAKMTIFSPDNTGLCTRGELLKASLPTVYVCTSAGKRLVLPDTATDSSSSTQPAFAVIHSWYGVDGPTNVKTITDAELSQLPLAGNATLKPWSLVRIAQDSTYYVTRPGGVLRRITPLQAAIAFGDTWENRIIILPDFMFTNYVFGYDMTDAELVVSEYDGDVVTNFETEPDLGIAP